MKDFCFHPLCPPCFRSIVFRPDSTLHREQVAALDSGLCLHGQHEASVSRAQDLLPFCLDGMPGSMGQVPGCLPFSMPDIWMFRNSWMALFFSMIMFQRLGAAQSQPGKNPTPRPCLGPLVFSDKSGMRVQDSTGLARMKSAGRDEA